MNCPAGQLFASLVNYPGSFPGSEFGPSPPISRAFETGNQVDPRGSHKFNHNLVDTEAECCVCCWTFRGFSSYHCIQCSPFANWEKKKLPTCKRLHFFILWLPFYIYFYFVCIMSDLPACISMHHMPAVPLEARRGNQKPWN